jgi:hypothetical protein
MFKLINWGRDAEEGLLVCWCAGVIVGAKWLWSARRWLSNYRIIVKSYATIIPRKQGLAFFA